VGFTIYQENGSMKYIVAIVQPSRLEAVKEALSKIEVFRLTVTEAQGIGRQRGHTEVYRGHEYQINFIRKVKLEIAVDDKYVEPTVEAIINAARTGAEGKIGDGKIFILPLEDVIRIRTRERGSEAL
jgi:nitrogen regulatory protein P-II 1